MSETQRSNRNPLAVSPLATLTEADWDRLDRKQRQFEENACALGEVRFRKRLQQAQDAGEASTVGATRKLLAEGIDRVEAALDHLLIEWLGEWDDEAGQRTKGKRGRPPSLVTWAKVVEAHTGKEFPVAGMAYIGIKTVLDSIHEPVPLTKLSNRLARRMVDQMRYDQFQREAPALFQYKMEKFTTDHYSHRKKSLNHTMKYAEVDTTHLDLAPRDLERMGITMLELVALSTNLIKADLTDTYEWSKSGPRRRSEWNIIPTPETSEWISRRNEALEILQTVSMPMVVPPADWTPEEPGGYRYNLRVRGLNRFVRSYRGASDTEASYHPMPMVYEAVNTMQKTPFAINLPVLALMERLEKRGGGRAGIPPMDPIPQPAKLFDTKRDAEELRKERDPAFLNWLKQAAKAHALEAERVARAGEYFRTVDAAQEVADEVAIWFPWNLDFRGRAYPIADALSPQGDDRQKGLLRFAEGQPLGRDGAFWLAVHGANCLDQIPEFFDGVEVDGVEVRKIGKLSIQERNDWIEAHTNEICAAAEKPLVYDWWMDAEDPFMFYAFCLEWAGYYAAWLEGRGEEFVSYLPVAADGTCNGLQHFAALWRDAKGASHVNVTANARPQDVYSRVSEVVGKILSGAGDTMARLWIESGTVDRGLTKRPTMTFGYGSERFGFAQQIVDKLESTMGKDAASEAFTTEEDSEITLKRAAIYLAQHIWDALDEVVISAKLGMRWFQQCARIIAKGGSPVGWTVPVTGFRVVQPYMKTNKRRIETHLLGSLIRPVYHEPTNVPCPRRQANGISPNLIHSLDAAALHLTVVNCGREQSGMSFQMVHDSYATHAGQMTHLSKVLRESFVQIYTPTDGGDVLDDLLAQFQEQAQRPEEIPHYPEQGELDITDVLFSDHFFC